MNVEHHLKQAIKDAKKGSEEYKNLCGVYADFLDEQGSKLEAAKMRAKAGLSELRFYATLAGKRISTTYKAAVGCKNAMRYRFEHHTRHHGKEGREWYKPEQYFPGVKPEDIKEENVEIVTEEFRAMVVGREPLKKNAKGGRE